MTWPFSVVDLTVTEKCNMSCSYCYHSADRPRTSKPREMPLEIGKRVIDLIFTVNKPRRLNFFGGEPLLVWDKIQELVRYAQTKGKFRWGVTTNLTLLEEEMIPFFKRTGGGVHCSIDGTPEVMDQQRPFSQPAVEWLPGKVAIAREITPNDTARMTVLPGSKLFRDIGYVLTLGFQKIAPVPAFEAGWNLKDWNGLDAQMGLVSEWYIYSRPRGFYVKFLEDSLRALNRKKLRQTRCGAARTLVAVDADGRITPCHRFSATHKNDLVLGNVQDSEWDFSKYDDFLLPINRKQGCHACEARWLCAQGCPSVNYEASGAVMLGTPEQCQFARLSMKHARMIQAPLQEQK